MPIDIPANVNPVAAFAAVLAGTIIGSRHDPIAWLSLFAAMAFGAARWRIYTPLIASIVAATVDIVAVWSWWNKIGIDDRWSVHATWIFLPYLVVAYVGYGIGRLIPRGASADGG
jgi:hypothetical protein